MDGYSCPFLNCNKIFKKIGHKNRHERTHLIDRPFKCNHCDKTYSRHEHLKRHELSHTGIRAYTCDSCSKSFRTKCKLTRHINIHDPNHYKYKCNECNLSFSKIHQLKSHSFEHTGILPFECQAKGCIERFPTPILLRKHNKHCHENPKYLCSICGQSFVRYLLLNQHIKSEHPDSIKHKCDECYKSFSRKSHLNEHKLVHSNIPPNIHCNSCSAIFKLKSSLRLHKRKHHSN